MGAKEGASMPQHPTLTLNDGHPMPQLGLGVWQTPAAETAEVVATALAEGYRHVDTAAIYRNEAGVGEGLRRSGLAREELFVTTKLWNDRHHEPRRALEASLEALGLAQVDLYLVHWPVPSQGSHVAAWKGVVALKEAGLARSVGVSNYHAHHLREAVEATGVVPAVNQIELHPWLQQRELRALHAELGIVTEAWSPLAQGAGLGRPEVEALAAKHGKSPAQILLRWHLQGGWVVIPKSVKAARIRENAALFDFALDEADMAAIASWDAGMRMGPDPDHFG